MAIIEQTIITRQRLFSVVGTYCTGHDVVGFVGFGFHATAMTSVPSAIGSGSSGGGGAAEKLCEGGRWCHVEPFPKPFIC